MASGRLGVRFPLSPPIYSSCIQVMIIPKLILFDLGGVLVDCDNSFATAAKELELSIDMIDSVFDKYEAEITLGKITPQQLYDRVLTEQKISANRDYDFLESWVNDYKTIKATFDLLPCIAAQYQVALLSNTYRGVVELVKARRLIPQIKFEFSFLSCELGMQKPDLSIYEFVEKSTGLNGAELLFIDDRVDFLIVPQKMGWGTIQFKRSDINNSIEKLTSFLKLA